MCSWCSNLQVTREPVLSSIQLQWICVMVYMFILGLCLSECSPHQYRFRASQAMVYSFWLLLGQALMMLLLC